MHGLYLKGQVLCGHPYPLPNAVAGSWSPTAVPLLTIPGVGLEKCYPSSSPGTLTAADEHLGRRYVDFWFLFWEVWRLAPLGALKRGESHG